METLKNFAILQKSHEDSVNFKEISGALSDKDLEGYSALKEKVDAILAEHEEPEKEEKESKKAKKRVKKEEEESKKAKKRVKKESFLLPKHISEIDEVDIDLLLPLE